MAPSSRPDGVHADVVIRDSIDLTRPALPTTAAAGVLGRSRHWVEKLIKANELGGYGVRAGSRHRWFAYVDALAERAALAGLGRPPPGGDPALATPTTSELRAALAAVADERDRYRAEAAALRQVQLHLLAADGHAKAAERAREEADRRLLQAAAARERALVEKDKALAEHREAMRQILLPRTVRDIDPDA